jgi:hypothetical protein
LPSISVVNELGEKFLSTAFRAKLLFKPTPSNEAKLAATISTFLIHCES